jgi:hypothetical protein
MCFLSDEVYFIQLFVIKLVCLFSNIKMFSRSIPPHFPTSFPLGHLPFPPPSSPLSFSFSFFSLSLSSLSLSPSLLSLPLLSLSLSFFSLSPQLGINPYSGDQLFIYRC